jgi:hypothetical protein
MNECNELFKDAKRPNLSIRPLHEGGEGLGLAAQVPFDWVVQKVAFTPRNEGAVNSTKSMDRSSGFPDLPVSRRFMNAAPNCRRGVRTGVVSELENPYPVERSAGDQPCGRVEVEVSVEQWRKGSGASIDVFQQTSVIDWGD